MTDHGTRIDMSDDELRAVYRRISGPDVTPDELTAAAYSGVRHRRSFRTSRNAILGLCIALAIGIGVTHIVRLAANPEVPVMTAPGKTGPITSSQTTSCAFEYNKKTLSQRDWVVDATVRDLKVTNDTAEVTLEIHRWYRGGSANRIEAIMPSPNVSEDAPPSYGVGTRLLISGDENSGAYLGWACGFTRYYDQVTAAQWEKWLR